MALAATPARPAVGHEAAERSAQLGVVELNEPDGQILSYRHLAGSTEVFLRGTKLAPDARVKVKIGSRPGFVELDINRGGIVGLKPAQRLGRDFLTYVLWAVSVDGKASNLGEITFEGERPIAINVTTPYQTFWLMVTAEPSYAVADPSRQIVMYSVRQTGPDNDRALAISGDLFYFTHYSAYEATPASGPASAPNQLLQARKAVELASKSGVLATDASGSGSSGLKEEDYTREALSQATAFLERAEAAFKKDPNDRAVVQFARTAAQSAEDARALALGAVGGLLVRQLENENARLRDELAKLKAGPSAAAPETAESPGLEAPPVSTPAVSLPQTSTPVAILNATPLVKQPTLWIAVAGWAIALVLLFRRRPI